MEMQSTVREGNEMMVEAMYGVMKDSVENGTLQAMRRIKILTVLNGVSWNGLGKGTAGAFGACGAPQPTLYQRHTRGFLTPRYQGISPGGSAPRTPPRLHKAGPKEKPWATNRGL